MAGLVFFGAGIRITVRQDRPAFPYAAPPISLRMALMVAA